MSSAPRRFHLQRLSILVAAGIVTAGLFVPWAHLGGRSVNAFDHPWFRIPLAVLVVAIIALTGSGVRSERVTGPALGAIVFAALAIGAIAAIVAIALARSTFWAWELSAGSFVAIGGAALVVILGLAVGRPPRPKSTIGDALSSWKR